MFKMVCSVIIIAHIDVVSTHCFATKNLASNVVTTILSLVCSFVCNRLAVLHPLKVTSSAVVTV